jgi:phosphonate transport system substrate-binding protein
MLLNLEEKRMSKSSTPRILLFGLVILTMLLSACAPAATPTQAPIVAAPAATDTQAPAPTAAPTDTVAPTAAPTNTEAPPAATDTAVPQPTATIPAAVCNPLAKLPTVKAGELGSADKPIVITFVPSGDSGKITKAGTAIAECLSSMTGLAFNIEVGTSYAASIEAMGANKAQVGFLNTFSVLLAEAKYQIVPVLGNLRKYNTNAIDPDKGLKDQMEPFYKGQFITKADSGIKTLADLKGKSFCFVEPNSASGYIVPHIILKANGIDPDKDLKATLDAGSHPNVAVAVYNGDCDAGVTFIDVLTDAAANLKAKYPDIADKVVAFQDTDKIPNDGVQVTKDLDPTYKDAIVEGLLAMAQDPGGAAVLKALYSINGFTKIDATFYDEFANILKKAGVDPASLVK